MVQRAAERLVPATGLRLLSSLMTFGLLLWLAVLVQASNRSARGASVRPR